ncbi:uncharacterized protein J8A68_002020 [[Candida] subhashii]|uniref:NuA3 HAT complex component NTO1 n=1 Tax=[Candida] subhashii TaxID=561895 RepID=A0A8J5QMZ0_9ASCO|nr:uncharacterized protein J8A68_002020 [[Candida] subhashii]KAG7664464.1 hypothetical protein J8A68_002020 [[Candida] subhashii]
MFDYTSKPREERDFKEIYPDFDETEQLPVFILHNEDEELLEDEPQVNNNINNNSLVNIGELKKPTFTRLENIERPNQNIKFLKSLTDYGFQEPNKVNTKHVSETYIRPFQLPPNFTSSTEQSIDTIEKLIERKKNLVEYDMDEQDYVFIKHRNSNPENVIKIAPEIFEIMMTTLENEWNKLEHQMNSMISNSGSLNDTTGKLLTIGHNNAKYGNDDGIVPGSMYDQKCAVCNDSDCDNSNAIVFCDGCDIAVHQECYGVAFIPEGQWLCRKCMINKTRPTECVFCPSTTGAFKQLDNSLWSHVVCGLWINELYFANPIYMEPIEGMDNIPKSRWKLTCYICKQRVGACIQCSNRSCFSAYHVTCAKRAGLYMEMSKGIRGAVNNKMTLKSYCEKHSPSTFDVDEVFRGIERTRLFFRDTKILNEENARLSISQKTANKLNIFKWKTETGTPIAPKLFSDVLLDILLRLKVQNQTTIPEETSSQVLGLNRLPNRTKQEIIQDLRGICDEVCRYWCLKRELKRGAPLIRKNNNLAATSSILYDGNSLENEGGDGYQDENKLKEKINFANSLIKDLEKLSDMSQNLLQRQLLEDELDLTAFNSIDTVYFPIKTIIEITFDQINKRIDANEFFYSYKPRDLPNALSLREIAEKNSKYGYNNLPELLQDADLLISSTLKENKPSTNIHKKMKVWGREFKKQLTALQNVESICQESQGLLTPPHIIVDGTRISLKPVDFQQIARENDLSDVDDIELDDDKQLLQRFLDE